MVETKRQAVHIGLLVIALLLKYLTRWQAVALLGLLLFITLFVMPQLTIRSHFYREFERRYSAGAVLYVLVLLVLLLVLPLPILAASWSILALGDGAATLVGTRFRAHALPWNPEKTYAGSLAFLFFGTLGASALLWWILPALEWRSVLFLGVKTTMVATIVESLPWKVNDNITVPLASAVVLSLLMA